MTHKFYPTEYEPDPKSWGICVNSQREDGKCRHRLSRPQHLCLGRDCPEDEDK